MRNILFAICICTAASTIHGQRNSANWANLSALHAGDKIQVREVNSTKVTGEFSLLSDTSISMMAGGTSQVILKQDVGSVKLMKNRHRLRNALILAGVGAGVGAGIGAAQHKSCPSSQSFCLDIGGRTFPAAIGGTIGLLGGGVAGALLPSHDVIYTLKAQ